MKRNPLINDRRPGVTLSWAQMAVGLLTFVFSVVTPLLVFIDQTNVNLAVLNQRSAQQEEMLRQAVRGAANQQEAIQRLDNALTRIEARLLHDTKRKGAGRWE